MENLIFGAIGALTTLGLLALGFFLGRREACGQDAERTDPGPLAGAAERQMREEAARQQAFEELLRYSAEDAYGLRERTWEDERGA